MENVQFMNFTGQSGIFANTFLDGNIEDSKKIEIENQTRLYSFNQTQLEADPRGIQEAKCLSW